MQYQGANSSRMHWKPVAMQNRPLLKQPRCPAKTHTKTGEKQKGEIVWLLSMGTQLWFKEYTG